MACLQVTASNLLTVDSEVTLRPFILRPLQHAQQLGLEASMSSALPLTHHDHLTAGSYKPSTCSCRRTAQQTDLDCAVSVLSLLIVWDYESI